MPGHIKINPDHYWLGLLIAMNTTTQITLNLTLTGQLAIDAKDLEQIFRGIQIQVPSHHNRPPVEPVPKPPSKLAYNTKETAELLGTSTKTVYRLLERGLLKSSVALRHKRIPKTEIERFLKDTVRSQY
jgi:excisionase family DNA binding protein